MKTRATLLALLLAAFVVAITPVWAQDACQSVQGNLVTNCGFETGDFSGWTLSGNTGFSFISTNPLYVNSGTYGAQLGPVGSDGFLSQTIWGNTLSFEYRQDPFYFGLDSVVLVPTASCGPNCEDYLLAFYLSNDGGTPNFFTIWYNGVDQGPDWVDQNAFPFERVAGIVQGVTPEPSSVILMGSGILGLAGVVRRKLKV